MIYYGLIKNNYVCETFEEGDSFPEDVVEITYYQYLFFKQLGVNQTCKIVDGQWLYEDKKFIPYAFDSQTNSLVNLPEGTLIVNESGGSSEGDNLVVGSSIVLKCKRYLDTPVVISNEY